MSFGNMQKMKAVTFSYDDGVVQDIRLVELLNKYGLKCTFNLNSDRFGRKNIFQRDIGRICGYRVHADDVKYIYEGHEVAVHTLTHPHLTELNDADVIREVEQDRLNLSDMVGYEVVGMAYPFGLPASEERVPRLIKENTGVLYSRTTILTDSYDKQNDLYRFAPNEFHLHFDRLMEMGEKFIEMKPDKPQLFYIWGHAYEMDYASENWVRLEEFFKLISNHDDIFYGTNKEVLL